jgi:hypothetical protein
MIDDDSGFLSTLYHALRTHRRRRVIRLVQDAGSTVLSVQTLAREIAAAETESLINTRLANRTGTYITLSRRRISRRWLMPEL